MMEELLFYSWAIGALGWAGYCLFSAGMEQGGYYGDRANWYFACMVAPIWFLAWPARFLVKLGEQYRENRNRRR